jgi:hypothetical protein
MPASVMRAMHLGLARKTPDADSATTGVFIFVNHAVAEIG